MRPSASGASVVRQTAGTTRRGRTRGIPPEAASADSNGRTGFNLVSHKPRAVRPSAPAMMPSQPSQGFQGKGDALAATDAQCHHAATQAVTAHRVQQPGYQHRARRADRVAMGDGAALDIDDVLR
jgi:hypothetical protein